MIVVRCIAIALALTMALMAGGCAITAPGKLTIEQQGSFFVGGRKVQAPGSYDPTLSPAGSDGGQAFWVDQMYVQYQIPANARKLPLILVHGGSGTGRVWETTPDGREGYQTLMLRRGYPVYIVHFPRRGRAGYPSFNGPFGTLAGTPIVANRTGQAGLQYAWSRWRLGPQYPEVFPVQQFPMQAVDSFMQHLVPTVSDDPQIITGARHIARKDRPGDPGDPFAIGTFRLAGRRALAACESDRFIHVFGSEQCRGCRSVVAVSAGSCT